MIFGSMYLNQSGGMSLSLVSMSMVGRLIKIDMCAPISFLA